MSHADEVLLYVSELEDCQLLYTRLLVSTSWYLAERKGNYILAKGRQKPALHIQQKYLDADDEIVLGTMGGLANTYQWLERYEEAEKLEAHILEKTLSR